jgi:hypothetical protein
MASLVSDGFNAPEEPERLIEAARAHDVQVDIVTFAQTLPDTEPIYRYPFERDNFAVLRVSTFEDWWTNQIGFKARNKARKGEKRGLVVREVPFDTDLVRGISAIYNETPVRQGKRFWHYAKDLDTVRSENATFLDQSIFIGAFFEGELVGFLKLVVDKRGGQAAVMQILSTIKHREKAPTNALISAGVKACASRQIPCFVYAHMAYGQKSLDSLATFKASNGFVRVDIPRYYVPLTAIGRLALRLGLHHRISERIPRAAMDRLLNVRRLWYEHRFPTQSEQ